MTKIVWLNGITRRINNSMHRLAEIINKRTRDWTARKWKVIVIMFCITSSALSVYSVLTSFAKTSGSVMTVLPINVPRYTTRLNDDAARFRNSISDAEYKRLKLFDVYMDSLKNNTEGRPLYDSIIKFRSGLLDTVKTIEEIYLSQKH